MKREVELKFFVDDLEPIRKRLKKIGAKCSWAGKEKDLLLDSKSQLIRKRRGTLRLRDSFDKILTYKEPVKGGKNKKFKIRNEYEVSVDDVDTLKFILGRLGFSPWFSFTKPHREYWRYQGAAITLDLYPFCKFVEVEASQKKIKEIAKKLGLDFARSTTKSYVALLREHSKEKR